MKTLVQITAACLLLALLPARMMAQDTKAPVETGKDPCSMKYKLDDAGMSVKDDNGYLVMQFDFTFSKNSDIPASGELFVKITNCKGEQQYVKMTLKYDSKTGKYMAVQAMPQVKECPWTVAGITMQIKDPCGDTYSWCAKASGGGLVWNGKHIEKGVLMC